MLSLQLVQKALCCSKKYELSSFQFLIYLSFAGMPLSAPSAQEHLLSTCQTDHQSRWPMGEFSVAGNPEGGILATKTG